MRLWSWRRGEEVAEGMERGCCLANLVTAFRQRGTECRGYSAARSRPAAAARPTMAGIDHPRPINSQSVIPVITP